MTLTLPRVPDRYDRDDQGRVRLAIEQADRQNLKRTGDITFDHELYRTSITTGITASTTQTQGQQALTARMNVVATVANANDVVTLLPAAEGRQILIRNEGANALQIFPALGDAIDGGSVDASVTLASGAGVTLEAADGTNWYAF